MSAPLHDAPAQQFRLSVDGHTATLDYLADAPATLRITHVRVPDAIGGRGIAAQLMAAAVAHADAAGLKIWPQCSYARAWMARHPALTHLIATPATDT